MSRRSKKSRFRSTFEEDVSKLLKGFDYEPFTVPPLVFSWNARGTLETETPRSTPASEIVCQQDKSLSSY
jgi:hypothetical protein